MIARALSTGPKLVLADEPTGNLDTSRGREVLGLLRELCHEREVAILLVTHDPQAAAFADRAHAMCDGHLVEYEPDQLFAAPASSRCASLGMRLSSIVRLYRARLRARVVLVQELFAIVGIAVGVALLFASQVASVSLNGSVRALSGGIVGQSRLAAVARDPSGFDDAPLGEVQRISGVQAAVPVLKERAEVVGPSGEQPVDLIASDPRYAPRGSAVAAFQRVAACHQKALALPTSVAQAVGVAPLQTVTLQVGAIGTRGWWERSWRGGIGGLVHSPVALAPLSYVQRLAGMQGRITRILVRPGNGP